eukprot:4994627-Prymnesium_polylepis.1
MVRLTACAGLRVTSVTAAAPATWTALDVDPISLKGCHDVCRGDREVIADLTGPRSPACTPDATPQTAPPARLHRTRPQHAAINAYPVPPLALAARPQCPC